MYACWEWGCLRVLRAWGRLGLIRLPPYGSRHLYDRTLTHPPTVLPASQAADRTVQDRPRRRPLPRILGRQRPSLLARRPPARLDAATTAAEAQGV